jgi:molybdopterin molybdotransferase
MQSIEQRAAIEQCRLMNFSFKGPRAAGFAWGFVDSLMIRPTGLSETAPTPSSSMVTMQRLNASLNPLDVVLAALLDGTAPLEPIALPLTETLGCVAAEMPPLNALPANNIATVDGWAFCAHDLVGASSYSPLSLVASPVWVEAGDRIPEGCNCVVDSDLVEQTGSMVQVLAEAIPGQGVRRTGEDIPEGGVPVAAGLQLRALDLLAAHAAGLEKLAVRRPRLSVVDIPAPTGNTTTTQLIAESAQATGTKLTHTHADGRDAPSIARTFNGGPCDLLTTVGGTGVGRTDATVATLAAHGALLAHGIAMRPGRTAAIGKLANIPVIALPGTPDHALSAWWTLVLPVLDRLSGRLPRQATVLPLVRKISSSVGVAEVALRQNCHARPTRNQDFIDTACGEHSDFA